MKQDIFNVKTLEALQCLQREQKLSMECMKIVQSMLDNINGRVEQLEDKQ